MIVNIRGTSGSGKSTLVKRVTKFYTMEPVKVDWRRQPIGYLCYRPKGRTLWLPGHYEIDCGGCDTLPTVDFAFNLIRHYVRDCDVMYEGLIIQSDVTRALDLHKDGHELVVIALNTPLDECILSVQSRRDAKAKSRGKETKPLDPSNTRAKHRQVELQEVKFKEAGVDFQWYSRDEAYDKIVDILDLLSEE